METVTLGGFVVLAMALAAGGLVAGFLSGLLGIGGGGILVAVLYEVFGAIGVDPSVRMHLSVGTSLAIIIPTSLRSYLAHRARGSVDEALLRRIVLPVLLGVVIGAVVVRHAPGSVLKIVWAVCGSLLALKLYVGRDDWRLGEQIPRSIWVEVYMVLVGAISTLMSVGGGSFLTILMTLYNRPLLQAVSTSSGVGPFVAIPGAIGFIWAGWGDPMLPAGTLGYVSLLGAALIIPTSVFAAPIGVRMAHGLSRRHLELAFATFLAVMSLRFALS